MSIKMVYPECVIDEKWKAMLPNLKKEESQIVSEKVTTYLSRGTMILASSGLYRDVLTGESLRNRETLSDGKMVWSNILAHYVSKYQIQMPADFLRNAEKNNWNPPQLSEVLVQEVLDQLLHSK